MVYLLLKKQFCLILKRNIAINFISLVLDFLYAEYYCSSDFNLFFWLLEQQAWAKKKILISFAKGDSKSAILLINISLAINSGIDWLLKNSLGFPLRPTNDLSLK